MMPRSLRLIRTLRVIFLDLTIVTLLLYGCGEKDAAFFAPHRFMPLQPLADVTKPIFINFRPVSDIFLNDVGVDLDALDPSGATSTEPVSGLNVPSLRATWVTTPLTFSHKIGNTYTINVTPMAEGPQSISLTGSDNAGNQATGSFAIKLDRIDPVISANVPATGSTTLPSVTFNVTGGFTDAGSGVGASEMTILQPVNGQCTLGNPLFTTGTTPGTVVNNRYQFGINVTTFNVPVTLNGAPNDQRPRVGTYCFYLRSEDQAKARDGTAQPNIDGRMFRTDYTWNPDLPMTGTIAGRVSSGSQPLTGVTVSTGTQSGTTNMTGDYSIPNLNPGQYTVGVSNLPQGFSCTSQSATVTAGQLTALNFDCPQLNFAVSLAMSYIHIGPGDTKACSRITGMLTTAYGTEPIALESIPGATYSITWTGPGLVGSAQRTGTLDAQSQALDRQNINQFGTYTANVSVTYQGVTRMATGNVAVGSTQGTCPAP